MTDRKKIYDWFSQMFAYPDDYSTGTRTIPTELSAGTSADSQLWKHLELFSKGFGYLRLEELEELYTTTFDINPAVSLEVGWHLYGEQYERGTFLVRMRQLLHQHRIEESSELPDHLTHVLALIGRMDATEADQFVAAYLVPALKKIDQAFGETDNPYAYLTRALISLVDEQHAIGAPTNQEGVADHE